MIIIVLLFFSSGIPIPSFFQLLTGIWKSVHRTDSWKSGFVDFTSIVLGKGKIQSLGDTVKGGKTYNLSVSKWMCTGYPWLYTSYQFEKKVFGVVRFSEPECANHNHDECNGEKQNAYASRVSPS